MSASDASAVAANSRSRAACPRSPAAERAESAQGTTAVSPAVPSTGSAGCSAGCSAGACSRTTWAFVPLMPNDETAARRGRPVSGQARLSVTSSTSPADQSTCGVGSSTCSVLGTTPWRIASTILMMPATPAAACV